MNKTAKKNRSLYGKVPYNLRMPSTRTLASIPAPSVARLEARISNDLHALLKRAAELQGRTMTDFIVSAVQEAAVAAIEQSEIIRLNQENQTRFVNALMEPAKPNVALKKAFDRRQKLLKSSAF
jgi:uncharacterized protein (DUF1778 family)